MLFFLKFTKDSLCRTWICAVCTNICYVYCCKWAHMGSFSSKKASQNICNLLALLPRLFYAHFPMNLYSSCTISPHTGCPHVFPVHCFNVFKHFKNYVTGIQWFECTELFLFIFWHSFRRLEWLQATWTPVREQWGVGVWYLPSPHIGHCPTAPYPANLDRSNCLPPPRVHSSGLSGLDALWTFRA